MRILLIDDDRDDQLLFCEAVEKIDSGLPCDVADNGEQGIAKLRAYPEGSILIFLDINMPIMNGWDTVGAIRQDEKLRHCKVIMYSTSSHPSDKERAAKLGAGFLSKSNTFEKMVLALQEVIKQALLEQSGKIKFVHQEINK